MQREKVYQAIDSERQYQDWKWGTIQDHPHEVALVQEARARNCTSSDDNLKIARADAELFALGDHATACPATNERN